MAETDSTKYLRIALLVVGVIFIVGLYPAHHHLAVRLGVAHRRSLRLPPDDSGDLRDAWRIPRNCIPEPPCTSQPHLVHGVVERCAWRDHGGASAYEHRAHGTPLG